jgi:hypothetical protein
MNFRQDDWVDWLSLAEFVLNNAVSEIIGFFPFSQITGLIPNWGSNFARFIHSIRSYSRSENL